MSYNQILFSFPLGVIILLCILVPLDNNSKQKQMQECIKYEEYGLCYCAIKDMACNLDEYKSKYKNMEE